MKLGNWIDVNFACVTSFGFRIVVIVMRWEGLHWVFHNQLIKSALLNLDDYNYYTFYEHWPFMINSF